MDYELILLKYMTHVLLSEGHTCTGDLDSENFSDNEIRYLRKIADIIRFKVGFE